MTTPTIAALAISGGKAYAAAPPSFGPESILNAVGWIILNALPLIILALALYFLISRPLRRVERARVLLDAIESALAQAGSIEQYLVSMSNSRDPALGARFHLLAARIESGLSFVDALEKTPGLVPPRLAAMLKAGVACGNPELVLPACRKLLRDGASNTRAAINYHIVFALIINPIALFFVPFFATKIAPVLREIFTALNIKAPPFAAQLIDAAPYFFAFQMLLSAALGIGALAFFGAERGFPFGGRLAGRFADWISLRVPWRHKRIKRDFSAMLAMLLDSGMPEDRALLTAAAGTGNSLIIARAARASDLLRAGAGLTDAIGTFDDTGEFRWRLANAARGARGFFKALDGWHQSLDAGAYQQEQAAAHIVSTALIVINAASVAALSAAFMAMITQLSMVIYS